MTPFRASGQGALTSLRGEGPSSLLPTLATRTLSMSRSFADPDTVRSELAASSRVRAP